MAVRTARGGYYICTSIKETRSITRKRPLSGQFRRPSLLFLFRIVLSCGHLKGTKLRWRRCVRFIGVPWVLVMRKPWILLVRRILRKPWILLVGRILRKPRILWVDRILRKPWVLGIRVCSMVGWINSTILRA